MEIHNNQSIGIDAYVNQVHERNKVDAPENKPENAAVKSDTVVISDAARRVQEARRQLDEIPDVREDKVAQLRNQIQNGTYEIDSEKIASKMIKEGLFNDVFVLCAFPFPLSFHTFTDRFEQECMRGIWTVWTVWTVFFYLTSIFVFYFYRG